MLGRELGISLTEVARPSTGCFCVINFKDLKDSILPPPLILPSFFGPFLV